MYKSVVIGYSPLTKKMAAKVEDVANKMLLEGYQLVTMTVTLSAKAILVFKKEN